MVLIDRVAQIQEGTSEHDTEGELYSYDKSLLHIVNTRCGVSADWLHGVPGPGALSHVRHGSAPQPRRQGHLQPELGGRGPGHQGQAAPQVRPGARHVSRDHCHDMLQSWHQPQIRGVQAHRAI